MKSVLSQETTLAKTQIVSAWKSELKELGFIYRDLMFQFSDHMDESLQPAISIQWNLHSDTYLVHIDILIKNPFSAELPRQLLVDGKLRPDGVYLHVFQSSWWPLTAMPEALDGVKRHALPWFRRWCDPSFLVEKHEIAICERKHLFTVFEPLTSEQEEEIRRVWHRPVHNDEAPVPATVFHHASVLHFLNGNRGMAIQRTRDWLERIDPKEALERRCAEIQLKLLQQTN